jgi:hypothetical protein
MPEGEEGPVAIGTRARVKERRRTAIDLTGAVIGFICEARIYGEHEGKGAKVVCHHEFLGATSDSNASAEKAGQAERDAAIAKAPTYAAGARGSSLDFEDVGVGPWRQHQEGPKCHRACGQKICTTISEQFSWCSPSSSGLASLRNVRRERHFLDKSPLRTTFFGQPANNDLRVNEYTA